jgi:superfamily II DNA or RNA helicase
MGPVISEIKKDGLYLNGDIIKPKIKAIHTNFYMSDCRDYGQLLAAIKKDDDRNHLILRYLHDEAKAGHFCLVLSERIAHIKKLHNLLSDRDPDINTACITSKNTKEQRNYAIKSMNQGELNVLFATKIADEGLDIRRLDRLFLTCPVRSTNKITQQIGRIQRPFPGKHDAVVYDFVDSLCGLAKSQFYSRKRNAYADFEIEKIKYESENTEDASRDFTEAM